MNANKIETLKKQLSRDVSHNGSGAGTPDGVYQGDLTDNYYDANND